MALTQETFPTLTKTMNGFHSKQTDDLLVYRCGSVYFEGRLLQELAAEVETPFFLLSERRVRANYEAVAYGLAAAGLQSTIRYCAKTNNEPRILEILASCGSQLMVSYAAEAQLGLCAGFASDRLAYQRLVLREEEIQATLKLGIEFFHASSMRDLDIIEKSAAALNRKTRISLRLRNDFSKQPLSPLHFLSRRHGFAASEMLSAAERVRASRWMSLAAVNFYLGTQQERAGNYRAALRTAMTIVAKLNRKLGIALEEINLGGGIPSPSLRRRGLGSFIPGFKSRSRFSDSIEGLEEFCRRLSAIFRAEAQRAGLRNLPVLAAEPGRALVGNAGVLVTRICHIKGRWLFLDASHNYLGESPLLFSRAILPVILRAGHSNQRYHLSGGTLNTTDVIDVWRRLPALASGDLLILADAGAYSISRASRYAGLSPPVYLLRGDGSVEMVRRPENLSDLMAASLKS